MSSNHTKAGRRASRLASFWRQYRGPILSREFYDACAQFVVEGLLATSHVVDPVVHFGPDPGPPQRWVVTVRNTTP